MTQQIIEGRKDHDWRRTLLFGSFGATMGVPAYLFYAEFPARAIAPLVATRWKLIVSMICVDWAVFLPLVYLPTFYGFRQAIYKDSEASLQEYWRRHVLTDLAAATPLLVSSDVAMFTKVPARWRVPFLSAIGLVWVVYISLARGSREPPLPADGDVTK